MQKTKIARKIALFAVILFSSIMTSMSLLAQKVSADSKINGNELTRKALYAGLQTCYNDKYMKSEVTSVQFAQNGVNSLFESAAGKDGTVKVPAIGNSLTDGDVSCKQLFEGYNFGGNTISGLVSSSTPVNESTLPSIGYERYEDGGGRGCLDAEIKAPVGGSMKKVSLNKVCFLFGEDGKYTGTAEMDIDTISESPVYLYPTTGDLTNVYGLKLYAGGEEVGEITAGIGSTWSDIKQRFDKALDNMDTWPYSDGQTYKTEKNTSSAPDGSGTATYKRDTSKGAQDALAYFSGNQYKDFNELEFSTKEQYAVLSEILADYAGKGVQIDETSCDSTKLAASKRNPDSKIIKVGEKWCPVIVNSTVAASGEEFNVISSDGHSIETVDLNEVIDRLSSFPYESLAAEGGTPITVTGEGKVETTIPDESDPGGPSASDADTLSLCYNGSGALGWIMCPVIEIVGGATQFLYENFIDPALQVEASKLMTWDGGLHTGWEIFRNFANIMFGIAFAVVILSQVTGIGISNYNIKKILPRLIMVVVLVNLSFIICQIAVDLSNILGGGLRKLFADQIKFDTSTEPAVFDGIMSAILTGLAAFGTGAAISYAGAALTVAAIKNFMIPILLAVLACAISIIFFFVMLAARQAGIVILVLLAPAAIICYALPNTKSLFDRWRRTFVALLMVYPIAGLLMGGGEFVGTLMLTLSADTESSFFYPLMAMLITVIPFFFIPSLVRNSMVAMGNIGAKITQMGSRLGHGTTRAIAGTKFVQERQRLAQQDVDFNRGVTTKKHLEERKEGKGLIGGIRKLQGKDTLSRGDVMRLGSANANIRSIEKQQAAAFTDMHAQDGTINDFGKMESMLESAMLEYGKDERNLTALAQIRSLQEEMDKTEPGQQAMSRVITKLQHTAADSGTSKKDRVAINKTLRKLANDTMTHNPKIKNEAPILGQQLKTLMGDERDFGDEHFGDANTVIDNGDGTFTNEKALVSSIKGLRPEMLPDMNESDVQAYLDAVNNGTIREGTQEYADLMGVINEALTNSKIRGRIQPKQAALFHRFTDGKLLEKNSTADTSLTEAGRSYRSDDAAKYIRDNTSMADLERIGDGLKSGRISRVEENGTSDRQRILNALENTMIRAAKEPNFNLSSEKATKINQILSDAGVNMVQKAKDGKYSGAHRIGDYVRDTMDSQKFEQRLQNLQGIKVEHERQTLGQRHNDWRRATENDVQNGNATEQNEWIAEVRTQDNSQPNGYRVDSHRKLTPAEIIEAEELERRDVQRKISRDDEAYNQQQNNP